MANLIPPAARTKVKYEYWARVVTMWLFLVGTALLMVTLLQLPAYVLIKDQLTVFDAWYQEVSDDNEQFKNSLAVIERTNEISRFLNKGNEQLTFSSLIDSLQTFASDEIKITSIVIERKEGVISTVSVSGEAASRSALANYRVAIESNDAFLSAALPLSNLAKDVDIPFNISITLPPPEDV